MAGIDGLAPRHYHRRSHEVADAWRRIAARRGAPVSAKDGALWKPGAPAAMRGSLMRTLRKQSGWPRDRRGRPRYNEGSSCRPLATFGSGSRPPCGAGSVGRQPLFRCLERTGLADWGDAPGVGRARGSVWRHGSGRALDARPKGKPDRQPRRLFAFVKRTMSWREVSCRVLRPGVCGGLFQPAHRDPPKDWARDGDGDRHAERSRRNSAAPEKASGPCASEGAGLEIAKIPDRPATLSTCSRGRPLGRLPFSLARPMRHARPATPRDRLRPCRERRGRRPLPACRTRGAPRHGRRTAPRRTRHPAGRPAGWRSRRTHGGGHGCRTAPRWPKCPEVVWATEAGRRGIRRGPGRRAGQWRRWRRSFMGDQRQSCCASGSGSGSGDQ